MDTSTTPSTTAQPFGPPDDVGTPLSPAAEALFAGPGEVRERCRALDWAATPLGPVENWSPTLRALVRAALASPLPINFWCGPALTLVYNDAYVRALGAKHPRALGRSGAEVWVEIWPEIAPMFAGIAGGGPAVYAEDARFVMERADGGAGGGSAAEDAWFTFGLSAVRDEAGTLVAYFNPAVETTARVMADRALVEARATAERLLDAERRAAARTRQLQALTAALAGTRTVDDVARVVVAEAVAATGAATGMLALRPVADEAGALESGAGSEAEAVIVRQTGLADVVMQGYARFPLSAPGPAARCLRTGEAQWAESRDALLAQYPDAGAVWDALGSQAVATVPLTVSAPDGAPDVIGAMSYTWIAPRALAPEDREFFLALGRQAAQAVERARLLEAERRARARTEHLQQLAGALAAAGTPRAVADALLAHAAPALGAVHGTVGVTEVGNGRATDGPAVPTLTILAAAGLPDDTRAAFGRLPLDAATRDALPFTAAASGGHPVYVPNAAALAARYPAVAEVAARMGVHAVAALPLVVDEGTPRARVLGAAVFDFPAPCAFTADDRAQLETVARQGAQALARAQAAAAADLERLRLEAVLAALPVGVIVAEAPGGRLVYGNAGALQGEGPLVDTFFDPLPEDELRAWEGDIDEAVPEAPGAAAPGPAQQGPRARRRGHDWIDERTRALHVAIAAHLRRDQALVRVAVANLDRFEPAAALGARWAFAEWRRLLRELAFEDLLAFLTSEDERATELRQSTPFFGILPPAERDAIFTHFETL